MYETIIAWTGLGLLFILCLPLSGIQRLILWIYAWALRLILLGMVGAAAYLWFRPLEMPIEVIDTVRNFAWLKNLLPAAGAPIYGMCLAGLLSVVMLPLLMVVDICRRRSIRRDVEILAAAPAWAEPARSNGLPPPAPGPNRYGRREAADAMAQAGSAKTYRGPNA